MYNLVISHKGCADGTSSAWCYRKYLKDTKSELSVDFHECEAGGYLDLDYKDKDVLMLDLCYKRHNIEKVAKVAKSITIFDHHKSAELDLQDLDIKNVFVHFDMKRCGAQLTWDHFFTSQKERLWFLEVIADRDLWKWEYPDSKAISKYMFYNNMYNDKGYNLLEKFTKSDIKQITEKGNLLLEIDDKQIKDTVRYAIMTTLTTPVTNTKYNVYLVNCSHSIASDVGNLLAKKPECDFAAMYRYNYDTDEWFISLRADKDEMDVSVVFKEFGYPCGGHKAASGVTIKNDRPLKDIFVKV